MTQGLADLLADIANVESRIREQEQHKDKLLQEAPQPSEDARQQIEAIDASLAYQTQALLGRLVEACQACGPDDAATKDRLLDVLSRVNAATLRPALGSVITDPVVLAAAVSTVVADRFAALSPQDQDTIASKTKEYLEVIAWVIGIGTGLALLGFAIWDHVRADPPAQPAIAPPSKRPPISKPVPMLLSDENPPRGIPGSQTARASQRSSTSASAKARATTLTIDLRTLDHRRPIPYLQRYSPAPGEPRTPTPRKFIWRSQRKYSTTRGSAKIFLEKIDKRDASINLGPVLFIQNYSGQRCEFAHRGTWTTANTITIVETQIKCTVYAQHPINLIPNMGQSAQDSAEILRNLQSTYNDIKELEPFGSGNGWTPHRLLLMYIHCKRDSCVEYDHILEHDGTTATLYYISAFAEFINHCRSSIYD